MRSFLYRVDFFERWEMPRVEYFLYYKRIDLANPWLPPQSSKLSNMNDLNPIERPALNSIAVNPDLFHHMANIPFSGEGFQIKEIFIHTHP